MHRAQKAADILVFTFIKRLKRSVSKIL